MIILRTVQGRNRPGGQDPNVHGFVNLREKLFVRQKVVKLVNCPGSVQYIKDDVWMCQKRRTVQIFDQNLECLRKLSDQQWGNVRRVTELPNGDVVLAGYGGLYHLTATGETKTAIDAVTIYNSSVFVDDKLFASCWNPPRLIVYTLQNDRWETRDTISLADVNTSHAYVTLATANGKIFACSDTAAKVFVLSQSGEVLQTHGKRGSGPAGELSRPELCAVDSQESMLVADWGNDRLQVCDVSSQWTVLDLQPPLKGPNGAVFIDNKLYVCCTDDQTLSVYSSEKTGGSTE